MRGTAKQHGFLHIGANLVAKGVLGRPHGADPPIFHMHTGKIVHFFFEVWGFHQINGGFGVDGPCNTAGHLQNTPGTPAIRFPLGAAGSQSALYRAPISACIVVIASLHEPGPCLLLLVRAVNQLPRPDFFKKGP